MQIPIVSGVYSDVTADYRTSYPLNLIPVPKLNGIANGYLKKADGIRLLCDVGDGQDRGGINWGGVCYRVVGNNLYQINANGSFYAIGVIDGNNPVTFAYSFERLAICGGDRLYYYTNGRLEQVISERLGDVKDVVWIDGYFVTTDGEYIVQTELKDPTQVSPLKYGSSEIDPDNITGLLKVRNELVVFNRYTIEVFDNVGGMGFAFARIDGAMIPKGLVSQSGKCLFAGSFAFVGGAKNEPCSVYLGANGGVQKIATREIERILSQYSEDDLSSVVLEAREYDMHEHLYLHLPNATFVYDFAGSQVTQIPIWFELSSSTNGQGAYRGIHHVWAYNRWVVGDRFDGRIGVLDGRLSSHYGQAVTWRIDTTFIYNGGIAGQIKAVELVGLTGRCVDNSDPQVFLSWTKDGVNWSNERLHRQGLRGQYTHRILWLRAVGLFRQMVGLRFRGCDDSLASFSAVEIDIEPLGGVFGREI